jgi:hypothetical protein
VCSGQSHNGAPTHELAPLGLHCSAWSVVHEPDCRFLGLATEDCEKNQVIWGVKQQHLQH